MEGSLGSKTMSNLELGHLSTIGLLMVYLSESNVPAGVLGVWALIDDRITHGLPI